MQELASISERNLAPILTLLVASWRGPTVTIKNINEITDFDLWYETYSTKELVDLKKHLSESDFELLKKLGIEVKDKIYTEQELEYLDMDLIAYYINEEDMDEEEIKESKDLPENVTREEFNELLEKVNNISIKFNF